jgi:hypothetical protein
MLVTRAQYYLKEVKLLNYQKITNPMMRLNLKEFKMQAVLLKTVVLMAFSHCPAHWEILNTKVTQI